jgi:hypothetical protein
VTAEVSRDGTRDARIVVDSEQDRLPVGVDGHATFDAIGLRRSRDSRPTESGREFTYDIEGGVDTLAKRVLDALRRYVTDGEWDEVRSSMPKELQTLVPA